MLEHTIAYLGSRSTTPILGICASASGMGKTTLLESVLPILKAHGLRIAVIKQARADFDVDQPGKDSHRLRSAGADTIMVGSARRWVLMNELPQTSQDDDESRLQELLQHMDTTNSDLILVEGFREAAIPKIEVYRAALGRPLRVLSDWRVIAVASDTKVSVLKPVLDLNAAGDIASFILDWHFRQQRKAMRA